MADALTLIGAVVVGGGLLWVAYRMEPHWSSKDGTRFTCRLQLLSSEMSNEGLHKEMRATVIDGAIQLSPRGLRGSGLGGTYRVLAKSPDPPRGRAVYLVSNEGRQMTVRVPSSSRCVPLLDALVPA